MRNLKSSVLMAVTAFALAAVPFTAQAQGNPPTDPQIVQVVQTANQIDIDQAKLALQKTKNQQVKDFANQMISDHTSLEKSVADLAKKLNVTPQDSDTSRQLKQQAAEETKKLKPLRGKAFDQEYVSHEVAFHQAVIEAASKTLIPNAKSAELKSALESAAPLLQGHMQHAQELQKSLAASK